MSMLTRYQKSGGFIQLLQLIETCGKQKQDNFLQIIEKENAEWAATLRTKMLTLEKVLKWDNATLAEVAVRLQELTLATALHGFKPEDGDRLMQTFTHSQKRIIEDLKKSKVPTPAEINAAFMKILVEVRNMITQGYIRLEKIDPDLIIAEDIEDKIGKDTVKKNDDSNDFQIQYDTGTGAATGTSHGHGHQSAHSSHSHHGHGASGGHGHDNAEVGPLRMKVQSLANENTQLKSEVKILREKLAQIKKIA